MYESFFRFKDTPFRLSVDEKFRYAHKNYLRASAYLAYALQQGEGLVMITGQPGSGKTTLIRDVISELDKNKYHTLNLITSHLHAEELLRKVALEYGLPAESYSKATLLTNIQKHLFTLHEQGKHSILFLDEAQNLSPTGLEELRLLSNLQQGRHSLLQVVLAGHEELRQLLLGPDMEHFQQRLVAICQIKPMSFEQTRAYIIHRLEHVDWQNDPEIGDEVFQLIHMASQGVPRNINHLMSHLLLFASLEEKHNLTDEDALTIIEELVDQQRITLPEEGGFEGFVSKYRAERQQQTIHHGVDDHPGIAPLPQESPPRNQEQQGELPLGSDAVQEEFLSANDQTAANSEEKHKAPNSDWFLWNNNTALPTADAESNKTEESKAEETAAANFELPADNEPPGESANQNRRSGSILPNADEIWHGAMDSMEMASVFPDSLLQRTTSPTESPTDFTTTQPADEKVVNNHEHSWGGVWFMSSKSSSIQSHWAHRTGVFSAEGKGLPSASSLNSSHNITVDENLSMPSVWVESCPEVSSSRNHDFRYHPQIPTKANRFKRSIEHMIAWLMIGMLLMLTMWFFSDLLKRFWHDMESQLYNQDNRTQDVATPLTTGDKQVIGLSKDASADLNENKSLENPSPSPSTEPKKVDIQAEASAVGEYTISEETSSEETSAISDKIPLDVGDSDISSFENIELATRYVVYFDFNQSTIPSQYNSLLNSIRNKMLLESESFLKITGYADSQGNRNYNHLLSMKRAKEVKEFFTMRGIADDRLQVAAVGSISRDKPWLESLDTRRAIRRVEVILFPRL